MDVTLEFVWVVGDSLSPGDRFSFHGVYPSKETAIAYMMSCPEVERDRVFVVKWPLGESARSGRWLAKSEVLLPPEQPGEPKLSDEDVAALNLMAVPPIRHLTPKEVELALK